MKNTLNKIMGVVLTLAMLSGLLIMAVPVSAATQAWSTIKGPPVTEATSANVFTIANDGKTLFLFANQIKAATTLVTDIAEGGADVPPDYIDVTSTAGFLSKGSITISDAADGANAETFAYTSIGTRTEDEVTFQCFKGITWPSTGTGDAKVYTNKAHAADDPVKQTYPSADAGKLYKSTDAGITWSSSSLDTGNVLAGKTLKSIKIDPYNLTDLVATDGKDLYRSTNGGRTWGTFSPDGYDPVEGTIYTADISEGETGIAYLAATSSGVYLYDSDSLHWIHLVNGWGGVDDVANVALAAAFSPNYQNVQLIVAVELGAADEENAAETDMHLKTINIVAPATTSAWGNANIKNCRLGTTAVTYVGSLDSIVSLGMPSNYSNTSTSSRVFVGLGKKAGDSTVGVYRVNGGSNTSTCYDLGANLNVSNLAYTGTNSSGVVAVGAYDDFVIQSTTGVGANSPTWDTSTNPPFGAMAQYHLQFAPGTKTLYAGAFGLGSGLATSTDYLSFPQISFISVSSYANTSMPMGALNNVGGAIQFQRLGDSGTGANMVFKSTDSGATWKEIYNNLSYKNEGISVLSTVPGDKDFQTIYLSQSSGPGAGSTKYVKSTDGGANWDTFNFPSIMGVVDGIAVIDANNFWMGSAAGIRKSSSTTIANMEGKQPLVMINIPGFFLIWTKTGDVYVSKDDGASFERLGNAGQFDTGGTMFPGGPRWSPAKLTFVMGPNPTIYCVDVNSGSIMKWVYGVDSSWTVAMEAGTLPASLQGYNNIASISAGGDGVWYIQAAAGNTVGQLWRSVDPLNVNYDPGRGFGAIMGSTFNGNAIACIPFMSILKDESGVPTYYTCVSTGTATNKYPSTWQKFTDVLVTGPKVSTPADGAVVGTSIPITNDGNNCSVDFEWMPVNYVGATYEYQIAWDSVFTNVTIDRKGITGNSLTAIALMAGKTYYFRVKVDGPMMSKWSSVVKFNTQIPSDVNQGLNAPGRISPENGASGIPLKPAITWGAVNGASSYDFKIATDAAFTSLVDSKDGLTTTVYTPSKDLSANTVYFWEVRANAGTNIGNWVISAFTTSAPTSQPSGGTTQPQQPQPTPTVVVNIPAQPAQPAPIITVNPPAVTVNPPAVTVNPTPPETPAYIWIIIAIGAVLVIAVIVLIARTRRV